VIDLSEARFQGVPEDLVVRDGVVNLVKNLSYGSDASSIARIMVAFQLEVDPPDVQAAGDTLVVRIAKPAGAAAPVVADDGSKKREAEQAKARAEAEAKEREEAARAEAKEQEEAARAEAKAKEQEAARAEAEAKEREEAARAEAKAKEQEEAARAAEAHARADAAKAEGAVAAERAAADANAAEKVRAEAAAAEQAGAERKANEDAAHAAAEQRAAAEREFAGANGHAGAIDAAAPERAPAAADVAEVVRTAETAPAVGDPPAVADASADRLEAGSPWAQLREIGFRQLPGASRVYVRTTVTPRFTIQDVGENVIRVELENTRATRRNDLRHLDTSFFPSAVAVVTPAHRGSSYVLEIKLRERVPYQQRIEGDMLAIDFERPAASGALPVAGTTPAEGGDGAELIPAALEGEAPPPAAN
jgi:hypothetical protein